MSEARKRILSMLDEKKISIEQADELLSALEADEKAKSRIPDRGLGANLGEMFNEVHKQVGKAVKSLQPQSREIKNALKGLGEWVSGAVGKVVTEIKLSQNELSDGVNIECMLSAPEGFSHCEKIEICNVWGTITLRDADEFNLKIKGKISKSALGEENSLDWLKKNLFTFKDTRLIMGFERSTSAKANVDLEIFLPTTVPLYIRSLAAQVSINGPFKIISIESTNGNVGIKHASLENTAIETVSADVEIDGSNVAFTAKTTSGDFMLKDCKISRLQIQSISGDIEISSPKLVEEALLELSTTSGDVTISKPEGLIAKLEGRTRSGTMQARWPGRSQPFDRNGIRLENDGPGAKIKVESISGDLTFE
ncbi:MAG: DUF4097 family beta strand repeat protein [Candidatus Riflebacteria bacterium]|nr:DUF4097 family beta strand repeat protein [Candidatus Riflebacteria bacterium]